MTVAQAALARAWLRGYRPHPHAAVRLVCLPHAGGGASMFSRWARQAPPSLDVVAVQYPGREDRLREPCARTLTDVADAVDEALDDDDDRPLALFGHSMGAAVAYELACRLEKRNVRPVHLFASGRHAPHCERRETVHLLDDDAFWDKLRELGGTSELLLADPEVRRLLLPSLRGDYRMAETYLARPAGPLRAPVTVFRGDRDDEVSAQDSQDWAAITTGPWDEQVFPGGHFYLVADHRAVLDAVLRRLGMHVPPPVPLPEPP